MPGPRAERFAVYYDPAAMEKWPESRRAWFETDKDVENALRWGTQKSSMLRWVKAKMGEVLTFREMSCIDMYYFENKTFAGIGAETGTSESSACRAVHRGLRKLTEEANATTTGDQNERNIQAIPTRKRWNRYG